MGFVTSTAVMEADRKTQCRLYFVKRMENLPAVPHDDGLEWPSVNKYPRTGNNFNSELNVKEGRNLVTAKATDDHNVGRYHDQAYRYPGIIICVFCEKLLIIARYRMYRALPCLRPP